MNACARWFCRGLALAAVAVSGACGAGLITGAASSSGSGGSSSPEVAVQGVQAVLPLMPTAGTVRDFTVTNVQLAGADELQVRLEALGVVQPQANPAAVRDGSSSVVSFAIRTDRIVQAIGDPTTADVPALLSVWRQGLLVGEKVPVLLVRQPRAALTTDPEAGGDPPPDGLLNSAGDTVFVEVDGLVSPDADLQVLVTTSDPTGDPAGAVALVTRVATITKVHREDLAVPVVEAVLPANAYPDSAAIVVRDATAGDSTPAVAFYRPQIAQALRSQGPTTGGTRLTLVGTALVPYDATAASPASLLRFDRVHLRFRKYRSGPDSTYREVTLPPEDFLVAESGIDRLVFNMPASPDGRPGNVDIILEVDLDIDGDGAVDLTLSSTATDRFLYSNPDPIFGPRGAIFDSLPVTVAPIALDNAPVMPGDPEFAPDFAALTDAGGIASLQLLLAQQNGMFQPFGAPEPVADLESLAERNPRDLLVGDFNQDQVPDLFVVNSGIGIANHLVVLGQARPLPPLGAVHRIPAPPDSWRGRVADFDGDGLADVLLVPDPQSVGGQPHILKGLLSGDGTPMFGNPILVPVSHRSEAFEVADLDLDGHLDIAVVSGTQLQLTIAYGRPGITFDPVTTQSLTIPDYQPDPQSPAVGLHACADRDASGTPIGQSLGLVLAGVQPQPPSPPVVTVLRRGPGAEYRDPLSAETIFSPEPIGLSLAADIDREVVPEGPIELLVAGRDDPALVSLALLQFGPNGFITLPAGVETGAESPKQIRAMVFDRAIPATQASGEAKAVFIVHESEIDGEREKRMSTRLVRATTQFFDLRLLPPDSGDQLDLPIRDLVGGRFHSKPGENGSDVLDLALMSAGDVTDPSDSIVLIANDGFGGFPVLSTKMLWAGLLPGSLCLLPAQSPVMTGTTRNGLLFLNRDSTVGFWSHDPDGPDIQPVTATGASLRQFAADELLQSAPLDDESMIVLGDVNGDGADDLVALLSFARAVPGPMDSMLAVLLGKPAVAPGEFPFEMPTELTAVPTRTTSIALGDFAFPRGLELAIAVQGPAAGAQHGEYVQFFAFSASGQQGRMEPASQPGGPQVLFAGSTPTRVAVADFNGDGLDDLLVANASVDPELRLYRNTSFATPLGQVDVAGFVLSHDSPHALGVSGFPTELSLSDVNGDGSTDAVVFLYGTEIVDGLPQQRTRVATLLSSGAGDLGAPRYTSPTRIGVYDAPLSSDLGDWNLDGVPDLFLGWGQASGLNLRVLFGGTR